jgi:hypothetical protein
MLEEVTARQESSAFHIAAVGGGFWPGRIARAFGTTSVPFELRQSIGDRHPLMTVWRFLQPLLLGKVRTNQAATTWHYDIAGFFEFFGSENSLLHAGFLHECSGNT